MTTFTKINEKNETLEICNMNGEDITNLIYFIYSVFPLDHEKMKELYSHIKVPFTFDDDTFGNDEFYNKDREKNECNTYGESLWDYYRTTIQFFPFPIKDGEYVYSFNKETYSNPPAFASEDPTPIKFIEDIFTFLETHNSTKKVVFVFRRKAKTLVAKNANPSDLNTDARGVREMDWKLFFWKQYEKECENKTITLHDLIVASYKVKSHKFDNGYEMFCGADLKIKDNAMYVDYEFDHGS
jgi:hypothetical protein